MYRASRCVYQHIKNVHIILSLTMKVKRNRVRSFRATESSIAKEGSNAVVLPFYLLV